MNTRKKILGQIDRTDRRSPSMNLLTPRRSPNSALPLPVHTQKQCTARGPPGSLPSLSLTTECSWIHLGGRVAKPLVSPLTPVPP